MITLSYGGGKQTVAIIVKILKGDLPKPDLIVMADTGREVQSTFDYMNKYVNPALNKIGLKVEIATHDLAYVDLYGHNGDLLLPAFTRQNGRVGKMPTFCSDEWKKQVIRRYLRTKEVKDTDVWLGISTDEIERMKSSGLNWYRHVYPLIEIKPTNRIQCAKVIEDYGWEVPNKSRCKMCPNQSPHEWRSLRDNAPVDFNQAVELESELRKSDEHIYLHPLAKPLAQAVEESDNQLDLFDGCDSGYCFV